MATGKAYPIRSGNANTINNPINKGYLSKLTLEYILDKVHASKLTNTH